MTGPSNIYLELTREFNDGRLRAMRDEFLSEEDLDLGNLSDAELLAWWNLWLEQAQLTNAEDAHEYTHGVFVREPTAVNVRPSAVA